MAIIQDCGIQLARKLCALFQDIENCEISVYLCHATRDRECREMLLSLAVERLSHPRRFTPSVHSVALDIILCSGFSQLHLSNYESLNATRLGNICDGVFSHRPLLSQYDVGGLLLSFVYELRETAKDDTTGTTVLW